MPFPNDRTYTPDINNFFADGVAITANGGTTVGGVPVVWDSGGNQSTTPLQQARISAVAVCDVTAVVVTSGCAYRILVNGSNDPNFGSGNVVNLGAIELGIAGTGDVVNNLTSVTGRYEVMFTTNVAGNLYEYVQVYVTVTGSGASLTLSGFIAVMPEP